MIIILYYAIRDRNAVAIVPNEILPTPTELQGVAGPAWGKEIEIKKKKKNGRHFATRKMAGRARLLHNALCTKYKTRIPKATAAAAAALPVEFVSTTFRHFLTVDSYSPRRAFRRVRTDRTSRVRRLHNRRLASLRSDYNL